MLPQDYLSLSGPVKTNQSTFRSFIIREKITYKQELDIKSNPEFINFSLRFNTMVSRCLVFVCCLIAAQAATINKRDIPVEVVYDKFRPVHYSVRNLDEKVQLSQEDLVKLKLSDEIFLNPAEDEVQKPISNPNAVKNLEEKVQLSPDELSEALKHLPNTIDDDVTAELVELENQTQKPTSHVSVMSLLKKAEEIMFHGIKTLRCKVDNITENVSGSKPTAEAWEKFNQTLKNFFRDQYKILDLKQDKPSETENQGENVIQNVIAGVQNISSDFITGITQQTRPSEDEQEQGGSGGSGGSESQEWWQVLINGFYGIFNNMNNLGGQNNGGSGQEDTGTDGGGSGSNNNGFFGVFTQFLQGIYQQGGSSTEKPVQGDEGTGPSSTTQKTPFEQFQSQITNVGNQISNFFGGQQNQNKPPTNPEDEGTSTSRPPTFIDNISQAFQNFFPNQGGSGGSGSGGSGEKNKDEDTPQKNDAGQKKPEEQKETDVKQESEKLEENKESGPAQEDVVQEQKPEDQKESEQVKEPASTQEQLEEKLELASMQENVNEKKEPEEQEESEEKLESASMQESVNEKKEPEEQKKPEEKVESASMQENVSELEEPKSEVNKEAEENESETKPQVIEMMETST